MSDKIKPSKGVGRLLSRLILMAGVLVCAFVAFWNKQDQRKVGLNNREKLFKRRNALQNSTLLQKRSDNITLSLVMATRVDSYGGAASFERMQNTLNMLDHYACMNLRLQSKVRIEVIVVEYNPMVNVARIKDVITIPKCIFKFRVILVPNSHHKNVAERFGFEEGWVVPVMEFVAKNIGIRRANGMYILPMAMDTILSKEFWGLLYSGQLEELLEEGVLYRAFRVDVGRKIPSQMPPTDIQQFLRNNVWRIWGSQWNYESVYRGRLDEENATVFMNNVVENMRDGIRFQEACGDFQLMHRASWWKIRGYWEFPTYGNFDSVLLMNAEAIGITFGVLRAPVYVFHQFHRSGGFASREGTFNVTNDRQFLNGDDQGVAANPNPVTWGAVELKFDETVYVYGKIYHVWEEQAPWLYKID